MEKSISRNNELNDERRSSISRKLSYLLRHTDVIDSQGFCTITKAMEFCGISLEELHYVVDNDDKNRFEIVDSVAEPRIRARNGHSGKRKIDPGMILTTPPIILYHSTTVSALDSIRRDGLTGMSRQYAQLSEDPVMAIEAASRHKKSSPVLLEISAYKAFCSGLNFYLTTNGVWQVEKIPYDYIREANNSNDE